MASNILDELPAQIGSGRFNCGQRRKNHNDKE